MKHKTSSKSVRSTYVKKRKTMDQASKPPPIRSFEHCPMTDKEIGRKLSDLALLIEKLKDEIGIIKEQFPLQESQPKSRIEGKLKSNLIFPPWQTFCPQSNIFLSAGTQHDDGSDSRNDVGTLKSVSKENFSPSSLTTQPTDSVSQIEHSHIPSFNTEEVYVKQLKSALVKCLVPFCHSHLGFSHGVLINGKLNFDTDEGNKVAAVNVDETLVRKEDEIWFKGKSSVSLTRSCIQDKSVSMPGVGIGKTKLSPRKDQKSYNRNPSQEADLVRSEAFHTKNKKQQMSLAEDFSCTVKAESDSDDNTNSIGENEVFTVECNEGEFSIVIDHDSNTGDQFTACDKQLSIHEKPLDISATQTSISSDISGQISDVSVQQSIIHNNVQQASFNSKYKVNETDKQISELQLNLKEQQTTQAPKQQRTETIPFKHKCHDTDTQISELLRNVNEQQTTPSREQQTGLETTTSQLPEPYVRLSRLTTHDHGSQAQGVIHASPVNIPASHSQVQAVSLSSQADVSDLPAFKNERYRKNRTRREKYANMTQQKKEAILAKRRENERRMRMKLKELWEKGTPYGIQNYESFKARRNLASKKFRLKLKMRQKLKSCGVAKEELNSLAAFTTDSLSVKRRRDMTKEEMLQHDREVRKKKNRSKPPEQQEAEKKAKAEYMRRRRQLQKEQQAAEKKKKAEYSRQRKAFAKLLESKKRRNKGKKLKQQGSDTEASE